MVYPSTFTSRLMAEMMPSVMVPRSSSPSGLPMAATASPTSRRVESPNWAGVRPAQAIFSTARSLCASCPTSRAWNTRLILEHHIHGAASLNDVAVGDDIPVLRHHHAGAQAHAVPLAPPDADDGGDVLPVDLLEAVGPAAGQGGDGEGGAVPGGGPLYRGFLRQLLPDGKGLPRCCPPGPAAPPGGCGSTAPPPQSGRPAGPWSGERGAPPLRRSTAGGALRKSAPGVLRGASPV